MSDMDVPVGVELLAAAPLTLHGPGLERVDSNSPVLPGGAGLLAFVSDHHPIGHTYRRTGPAGLASLGPRQPVRILDDPDPSVGKWIESVWRHASGRLYGWYHAEEVAPCPRRLFMPHVGALASDDDGLSWRHLGVLLRPGEAEMDCSYDNGFMAGGCGDFSVVPDRAGNWFHIHYSSYVAEETRQGVVVARYQIADRDRPPGRLQVWREGSWRAMEGAARPTPLWPMRRGWRHPDPDGFWGPAVHYNRDLGLYVMLLNHTRDAQRDQRSAGIHVSFNRCPADPSGWSTPTCIVRGGAWYPQVVGLGAGDGDTLAGAEARFFLAGFSAWTLRFSAAAVLAAPPLITKASIDALFVPAEGTDQRQR